MRAFRDLSLRRKLVLVMMLTGSVAVAVMFAAMAGYELLRYRNTMLRELATEAAMIGANSAAALAFDDARSATEVLSALRARPEIVQAWLLRVDGRVLAQYGASSAPPPTLVGNSHRFERNHLVLCQPVRFGNDNIGQICLRADMREQRLRMLSYLAIAAIVVALALAAAFWLSARLQRIVSEPVLALTRAVRDVGEHKDYGLRVNKKSQDEIGQLIDGFNLMLAQIQQRDEDLRDSEARFRQVMETIQEVFWLRDEVEDKLIYVSPAFQRIWGRSPEELYAAPSTWLEAVHPDDRSRVRQATVRDLAAGRYDEEYRVLRPDGSIRWVHDRAFVVKEPGTDKVIRVAGISEDVTERKRLEREILDISDREQRRIGHDIHDGLCQQLVGIAYVAKLLEHKLAKNPSEHLTDAREIGALLQQALTEARNLSHGLAPVRLDRDGLQLALHELSRSVTTLFNIPCTFDCPMPVRVDDSSAATHLYRIAQEAINNAVKHARCRQIFVRLLQEDTGITLVVEDDGVGLPPIPAGKGIGLHVMRSRARMINANFTLERRSAGGTILTCAYPQPS